MQKQTVLRDFCWHCVVIRDRDFVVVTIVTDEVPIFIITEIWRVIILSEDRTIWDFVSSYQAQQTLLMVVCFIWLQVRVLSPCSSRASWWTHSVFFVSHTTLVYLSTGVNMKPFAHVTTQSFLIPNRCCRLTKSSDRTRPSSFSLHECHRRSHPASHFNCCESHQSKHDIKLPWSWEPIRRNTSPHCC